MKPLSVALGALSVALAVMLSVLPSGDPTFNVGMLNWITTLGVGAMILWRLP